MNTRRRNLAEQARRYHALDWRHLVPAIGKIPAATIARQTRGCSSWRTFVEEPAGIEEVASWPQIDSRVDLALVTGSPSRVGVIDIDSPQLAPPIDIETARASTPSEGEHLFLSLEAHEVVPTQHYPWGELRAGTGGSIVVLPPTAERGWLRRPELGIAPLARVRETLTRSTPSHLSALLVTARESDNAFARAREAGDWSLPSWVRALDVDPVTALPLAVACGAPPDVSVERAFLCPLHPERTPSATLWRHEERAPRFLLHCWHTGEWLSLAHVRAHRAGRLGELSVSELAVWKLRAAGEAGLVGVEPELLVFNGEDPLCDVWQGFELLCRLRALTGNVEGVPYSVRFASCWAGVPFRAAMEALQALRRRHLLVCAGTHNRMPLWHPHTYHGRSTTA